MHFPQLFFHIFFSESDFSTITAYVFNPVSKIFSNFWHFVSSEPLYSLLSKEPCPILCLTDNSPHLKRGRSSQILLLSELFCNSWESLKLGNSAIISYNLWTAQNYSSRTKLFTFVSRATADLGPQWKPLFVTSPLHWRHLRLAMSFKHELEFLNRCLLFLQLDVGHAKQGKNVFE